MRGLGQTTGDVAEDFRKNGESQKLKELRRDLAELRNEEGAHIDGCIAGLAEALGEPARPAGLDNDEGKGPSGHETEEGPQAMSAERGTERNQGEIVIVIDGDGCCADAPGRRCVAKGKPELDIELQRQASALGRPSDPRDEEEPDAMPEEPDAMPVGDKPPADGLGTMDDLIVIDDDVGWGRPVREQDGGVREPGPPGDPRDGMEPGKLDAMPVGPPAEHRASPRPEIKNEAVGVRGGSGTVRRALRFPLRAPRTSELQDEKGKLVNMDAEAARAAPARDAN